MHSKTSQQILLYLLRLIRYHYICIHMTIVVTHGVKFWEKKSYGFPNWHWTLTEEKFLHMCIVWGYFQYIINFGWISLLTGHHVLKKYTKGTLHKKFVLYLFMDQSTVQIQQKTYTLKIDWSQNLNTFENLKKV